MSTVEKQSIFHLKRNDVLDYDESEELVVVAPSESEARKIAEGAKGDQSPSVWHATTTEIRLIGVAFHGVEPGIVMSGYTGA